MRYNGDCLPQKMIDFGVFYIENMKSMFHFARSFNIGILITIIKSYRMLCTIPVFFIVYIHIIDIDLYFEF